ncbi:MAG: hypothetical protein V7704_13830 [Aurantimonas endophytica]|uniref:hypothetical protein n=1 Tax=Aurantimonas endophytica TaxID=1522175 RepID=UPI003001EB53
MNKLIISAVAISLLSAGTAMATGIVPGSDYAIDAHDQATRSAVQQGAHVASDGHTGTHVLIENRSQTFGYGTSQASSRNSSVPGSKVGRKFGEADQAAAVAEGAYAGQAKAYGTQIDRGFIVPGSEVGRR